MVDKTKRTVENKTAAYLTYQLRKVKEQSSYDNKESEKNRIKNGDFYQNLTL